MGESLSRKTDGGVLGDLFEIAAMLPWWIGAALAVGAYFVFHSIATVDIDAAAGPKWLGAMDLGHPWQTLATFLQYLMPLLLLVGALASAIADERRRASEDGTGPAADGPAAEPPLD